MRDVGHGTLGMQSQELEDSFLIGQISAGDTEAFARFYDLH